MFAVGHIALGYITGKILGKATKQSQNIPALWTLSLLPDLDFLIPCLQHRGPTHSLIVAILIFTPLYVIWSRKIIPYFAVFATHSLIGDYFTGKVKLFWPLSSEWVKFDRTIVLGSVFETYIELALFGMLIAMLILSRDFNHLFHSELRNTLLFIPLCTIVLPVKFKYPVNIPKPLIIPHLFLLSIIFLSFSISMIQALSKINKIES